MQKHTAKEFIYVLMPMLWSRETLISHSVSGRQSNAHKDVDPKPQLDSVKVASICGKYIQNIAGRLSKIIFWVHADNFQSSK